MLGPYSSGLTKAIAPVTEQYGVPMVEAEGASRSLFTQGYKYLFAVLSTSEQYLASSIELAAEQAVADGKQPSDLKVAMAFENDPFSLDVREGVVEDAKKHGMEIVIDDKLPRDLSDMSATLTKVRALKPDLLVISGHSKGAATAARQIGEMNIEVPMVAMTHCEAAKVTEKFGDTVNDFFCPTQWAETLSYSGEYSIPANISVVPPNMTSSSRRPLMVMTPACRTRQHRPRQPYSSGRKRSSRPIPSRLMPYVTRSLRSSSRPSMAASSSNPWCSAKFKMALIMWWHRPNGLPKSRT